MAVMSAVLFVSNSSPASRMLPPTMRELINC